jgi:hypothetical protein
MSPSFNLQIIEPSIIALQKLLDRGIAEQSIKLLIWAGYLRTQTKPRPALKAFVRDPVDCLLNDPSPRTQIYRHAYLKNLKSLRHVRLFMTTAQFGLV